MLRIRPAPSAKPGETARRPIEVPGSKSKEFAALKGSKYTGYVDGDAAVTVRR
jgi:hypothetical protein